MTTLLARCRAADVRLWVEDGQLRYDAPASDLDPELRAELVEHKAELIEALTQPDPIPPVADRTTKEGLISLVLEMFADLDRDETTASVPALEVQAVVTPPSPLAVPTERHCTPRPLVWSDPTAPPLSLFDEPCVLTLVVPSAAASPPSTATPSAAPATRQAQQLTLGDPPR